MVDWAAFGATMLGLAIPAAIVGLIMFLLAMVERHE